MLDLAGQRLRRFRFSDKAQISRLVSDASCPPNGDNARMLASGKLRHLFGIQKIGVARYEVHGSSYSSIQ